MTKLCPVLGDGATVTDFRNRLRISYRRIIVGAVDDDHVEGRDNEKIVCSRAPSRIDTRKGHFGKVHTGVVDPPEVLVSAEIYAIRRNHFVGVTALLDPPLGDDLFSIPAAATQIEQTEPRQVPGGNFEMICRIDGSGSTKIKDVVGLKVLHTDRLGNTLIKRLADLQASLLFKDC